MSAWLSFCTLKWSTENFVRRVHGHFDGLLCNDLGPLNVLYEYEWGVLYLLLIVVHILLIDSVFLPDYTNFCGLWCAMAAV